MGSIPILRLAEPCAAGGHTNSRAAPSRAASSSCACPPFVRFLRRAGAPFLLLREWSELAELVAPYSPAARGGAARLDALQREAVVWYRDFKAHLGHLVAHEIVTATVSAASVAPAPVVAR